jgi:hypothetical protein
MAEEPLITITPQRVFCPSHGEPLRSKWPKVCYFVSGEELREFYAEAGVQQLHAQQVAQRALETEELLFDVRGRCVVCGEVKDCAPYRVALQLGSVREGLLCVDCVMKAGAREHESLPTGGNWRHAAAENN